MRRLRLGGCVALLALALTAPDPPRADLRTPPDAIFVDVAAKVGLDFVLNAPFLESHKAILALNAPFLESHRAILALNGRYPPMPRAIRELITTTTSSPVAGPAGWPGQLVVEVDSPAPTPVADEQLEANFYSASASSE